MHTHVYVCVSRGTKKKFFLETFSYLLNECFLIKTILLMLHPETSYLSMGFACDIPVGMRFNKTVIYISSFTNFHICCSAVLLIFQTKPSFPAIQKISHLINCGYSSMINYYFLVLTRTTKLHRCPIQKFNAKMMRLIYIICSKNLTNKGFHIFFANDGKLFVVKNQKIFSQKT